MAHLLMYSTNYTVCRRSACLCPRAESALAAPRDRKFPPSFTLPARFISVFQALREALTTSKSMVGRRLFLDDIVTGLTVVWSAAAAEVSKAIAESAGAILDPIKDLIDNIKKAMENLLRELTVFFSQAIKDSLEAMGGVGKLVADKVKEAMQGLNKICGVEIPSCLIGPPEGCEDGTTPVWESTIMTLSVSHFLTAAAREVRTWA